VSHTLRVDWPACKAHGLCAQMLPEVVGLDQWGYPVVHEPVTHDLLGMAKSTVKACPTLALRLVAQPKRH
jgi:ferredoxin